MSTSSDSIGGMTKPIPNPHPIGTPAWAEHDDRYFRDLLASGELEKLMRMIASHIPNDPDTL